MSFRTMNKGINLNDLTMRIVWMQNIRQKVFRFIYLLHSWFVKAHLDLRPILKIISVVWKPHDVQNEMTFKSYTKIFLKKHYVILLK